MSDAGALCRPSRRVSDVPTSEGATLLYPAGGSVSMLLRITQIG